jgi:CRISPR-associated exonuclease Cas4
MEVLVIPHFTWCDDTSWAKQLDFRLDGIPELDVSKLRRVVVAPPESNENRQSAEVFAEENSRMKREFLPIVWIKPSESDPDILPAQLPKSAEDAELDTPVAIEGSRLRGVILHKLMEELATGELAADASEARERARLLCRQLARDAITDGKPDPIEMADTALRTLALPELKPFRHRLVPEMPLYGDASAGVGELVTGRADAVARVENGDLIVFDWKSDVAPSERNRSAYQQQLGQYLRILHAQRGAVVYMTSGRIDWVTPSSAEPRR